MMHAKSAYITNFVRIYNTSMHTSQLAHQAGAYPGFCSKEWLGVFLLPLNGMLVHQWVTLNITFAGTHLYTWLERVTARVICLAQEHIAMSPARALPRGHHASQIFVVLTYFSFRFSLEALHWLRVT